MNFHRVFNIEQISRNGLCHFPRVATRFDRISSGQATRGGTLCREVKLYHGRRNRMGFRVTIHRNHTSKLLSDSRKEGVPVMNSRTSRRVLIVAVTLVSLFSFAGVLRAIEKTSSVEGIVTKIDRAAKTMAVKAADGTEHTMHLVARTVVHGGQETYKGAEGAARGIQEGSQVVVHYTKQGTDETAEEIDHIGKDGLKTSEGTITKFDRDARTMTIKTADGTEETYRLTEHASEDAGKDTDDAAKKSAHATVYYSEEAGHKVVHFFKTI